MVVESRPSGKDIWKVRQHTQFLYTQCAQQVLQDAKNYLAYKKNKINSDYAQARFDAVTELKNCMTANYLSTHEAFSKYGQRRYEGIHGEIKNRQKNEAEMEKLKAWKKDLLDTYNYDISEAPEENKKAFLGNEFTKASLEKIPSKFSTYRMGAVHVAMLALMSEQVDGKPKYTMEDILDCKKLQKEKQEMFKTVVTKMSNATPDYTWISKQIYEGSQIAHRYMGEYANKVDYSKPDFMYSRDFFMAGKLSMIMFDAWQESKNCKPEFLAYVQTKDPTVKPFDEAHKKLGNLRGLMDFYMMHLDHQAKHILHGKREHQSYDSSLLKNAFMLNEYKQAFSQRAKTAQGKQHIADWFTTEEMGDFRLKEGAAFTTYGAFQFSKEGRERSLPYVMDGSIFNTVKVEYKTVDGAKMAVLKGELPTDIIGENMQYVKMDPQDVYLKLNQQLDHFMELKKTADPDMQVYLDNAIRGMTELGKLSEKARSLTDEEKKVAKAAMKAVFSYHLADNFHDIGATGDTLRESVYQNIDKLEQYQRYVKNIDKGSVASLVISNQNLAVSNADEVILAKGKIAKDMLESGAYKTPKMVKLGFAFAYTQSVQEAAGKLPRDVINHKNPSPYEHAAHVFEHIDEYLKPDMIKQYQKKGEKPDLLRNQDKMRQYARNYKIGQVNQQANRQAGPNP